MLKWNLNDEFTELYMPHDTTELIINGFILCNIPYVFFNSLKMITKCKKSICGKFCFYYDPYNQS